MPTSSAPLVVGLGEILWDILPQGRRLGGAPANFAYHAHSLGANAIVVSCVGGDELGQAVFDRLDQLGVNRDYIAVDDRQPTGTVSVRLDAAGKPDYVIHQPAAWDFIPVDDRLDRLALAADAVCFGTLAQRSPTSRATIGRFLGAARPKCLKIFDVNLRQAFFDRDVLDQGLRAADVVKLNDEELPVVAELLAMTGDEDALIDILIGRYRLQLVALTKGARGAVLVSPGRRSFRAAVEGPVVDTIGAGDSFTAALALGLLRGWDLDIINDQAARVAAFVCSQPGATPKLPDELTCEF